MTNKSLNKVSIRLASGGHSFSPAALCVEGDGIVEVVISTPKTTLVPAELFVAEDPCSHLAAVGIAPVSNEQVVHSGVVDGIVAVMAINGECVELLRTNYGSRLSFVSPLLEDAAPEHGALIRLDTDVLYVRIYDGGLRFAEAMEVTADADLQYYLESIQRVYDIYNMYARAMGDTERLKRIAGRCFKNLVTA